MIGALASLPFKGRVRVGMGLIVVVSPIPLLASPLKGEERLAHISTHNFAA
jgi:hypothetical protein